MNLYIYIYIYVFCWGLGFLHFRGSNIPGSNDAYGGLLRTRPYLKTGCLLRGPISRPGACYAVLFCFRRKPVHVLLACMSCTIARLRSATQEVSMPCASRRGAATTEGGDASTPERRFHPCYVRRVHIYSCGNVRTSIHSR